ncbi:MAG: FG-GAP-like repeat-containing protein [candidate division WOR-3 bacterium]
MKTILGLLLVTYLYGQKFELYNSLINSIHGTTDQIVWNESRWQDFIDGELDPSLYVSRRAQLEPDSGCIEFFARFDVDNNGFYDLACADDSGPAPRYLRLYKGYPFGYRPESLLVYPIPSAGNIDLADLNLDGWAELIHSGWSTGYATIYWGTPNGPSATNTTTLPYQGYSEAVSVYDLDRDTYLDIIIGSSNGRIYIYWGSSSGYSQANRTEVNVQYSAGHNIEIADFDKDGWGDITVALWTHNQNPVIYWGPNRQPREIVWLPFFFNNAHGVTVADFNRDGWLDIVYQGYDQVQTSYIYFGSPAGFSTTNRTQINPGKCYGGSVAVDWNYDGWLDIVYLRGNWYGGGTWKPIVYLNTRSSPYFANSNSYELGNWNYNASGGFVADFNFDGNLDIFINNMLLDSSYILWGPNYTERTGLPVSYDHHGVWREPGNIYDRTFSAYYYSSVFSVGPDSLIGSGVISWVAYEPPETEVHIALRAGDTPIPDSTWTNFYFATNGDFLPAQVTGYRYLQYRATLEYWRPCYLPHLEKITITVNPVIAYDVGVTQITAPVGVVDSGAIITPTAVVQNFGNRPANFPVIFKIGTNYLATRYKYLNIGQSDTVMFSTWIASPIGTHQVKCSTALVGDHNPQNDFRIDSVRVQGSLLDVAVTDIWAPIGTVDSGSVITPVAVVRNYSGRAVNFPVTFRIGSNYSRTRSKQLAVNQSDTVGFQPWLAEPVGTYLVKCTTGLVGDINPANDFRIDSVTVVAPAYDVEVTQILAPTGIVDSGAVIIPVARVRNHSYSILTFPVLFTIGNDYSQRRNKTLNPLGTDTVGFPAWTAIHYGTHLVKCSTELVGDVNPGNDRKIDSVTVTRPEYTDAAAIAILAPTGYVDSGAVITPIAQIANYSTSAKTIPVIFKIGSDYSEIRTKLLGAGITDTVHFPNWFAQRLGTWTVKCSTALLGDENPANDLVIDSVTVRIRIDAGVREIIAPRGVVDSGAVIIPKALITNYSTRTANIPVQLRIGNNYSEEGSIILNPNETDTISFPTWTAAPVGYQIVKCTTGLVGDQNPTNDTLTDSVLVRLRIDAGVVTIIAPTGIVDSGTAVIPKAIISNYGANSAEIPVVFTIGNQYVDTNYIMLEPGAIDTISFRIWQALNRGEAPVKCSTALAGDQNPTNDVQFTSVLVRVKDVGTVAILSPIGNIGEGRVIPRAIVKNYGTNLESFAVIFKIGQVYTDTIFINLEPDSTKTIDFAEWQARIGRYVVSCSTNLLADVDNSNDQKIDSVAVWRRSVAVGPDSSASIYSGTSINYILYATNLGNALDTIDILSVGVLGNWRIDLLDITGTNPLPDLNNNGIPDVGGLAPNQSQGFIVRITSPLNELGNTIDTVTIIARSAADSSVSDNATLLTRIIPVYSVLIEPNSENQVEPNQSIEYELIIKNLGNVNDVFDLSMIHTKPYWQFALLDRYGMNLPDRNLNGKPDIGPMPAFGGEARIRLRITPDSTAQVGEKDTTTVFAESWADPLVYDSAYALTTVLGVITSLDVEWDQDDRIFAGETKSYQFWAKTAGNINEVINLNIGNRQPDWIVEFFDENGERLLTDSDNDGLPDLGIVRPGEQKWFVVKVKAPGRISLIGIPDSFYNILLSVQGQIQSQYNNIKDSAFLRLRTIPNLDIHNYENPFWDKTIFIFSLPTEGNVVLTVYNRLGEKVKTVINNQKYREGVHMIQWNGDNDAGKKLAPGTYLYLLEYTDKDDRIQRIYKKTVIAKRIQ